MKHETAKKIAQEIDELIPFLTDKEHTKEEVFELINFHANCMSTVYGKNQIIPFLEGALHASGYVMSQRRKMVKGNTSIVYTFNQFVEFNPTLVDGFNF